MASTYLATNIFEADGVRTEWQFSFAGVAPDASSGTTPYLYPEDVHASELYIDSAGNQAVAVRTVVLHQPNVATIVGDPVAAGRRVRIFRKTEIRFPLVDYRDRQSVSEFDLDLANRQAVFIAQETQDAAKDNLIQDNHGNYDAQSRRIVNMAPGIDSTDAVNIAQFARTIRAPSAGAAIAEIPQAAAERSGKVLSFDLLGNPVATFPNASSALDLEMRLASPIGSTMSGWQDPMAPTFLKTVSDMKAGEPVSLFRIVPKTEHTAMQNGVSTYDCTEKINEAYDLFHANTIKGGILEVPKGQFQIDGGLILRGGITLRGAGKDVSTLVIGDTATVRLLGLGNTIERLCLHKDTPRENYITAGHKTDAAQTASISEIGFCKFTATQLAEFVNYALIGNYRSLGIHVHDNRMFTFHLAFITKYLSSDWVRLENNYAKALQSANVFNSELFKIEAINRGWLSGNHLVSSGVPAALSCLTIESGTTGLHVSGNTMESDTGYAVRVEHSDNTITPPTDCLLDNNTLIATGDALAVYSGNAQTTRLSLSGGTIQGPVTLYGQGTNMSRLTVRANGVDPRTGLTLRGNDIKGRNIEVVGFGVGIANAAVAGLPDSNMDLRGLKLSGQANESIALKYISGKSYLGIDSINTVTTAAVGAVHLFAGGEALPADTLTVEPGSIVSPNTPGLHVDFLNGVALGDCTDIKSPTRVKLTTTDTYMKYESTFIAANFNSKTHRVNTTAKYAGKAVYNKDPKKPYFATGPLDTDVWVDAAGTVTYTPV